MGQHYTHILASIQRYYFVVHRICRASLDTEMEVRRNTWSSSLASSSSRIRSMCGQDHTQYQYHAYKKVGPGASCPEHDLEFEETPLRGTLKEET